MTNGFCNKRYFFSFDNMNRLLLLLLSSAHVIIIVVLMIVPKHYHDPESPAVFFSLFPDAHIHVVG
jgi:hypothetical protein